MKRINLLPAEQRVRASRERGRLFVLLGFLVLIFALGAVYYQQMSVANGKRDELTQLSAQTQAVSQQVMALRPYAAIHDTRTAMNDTSRELYDARVPWSTILEEISLVIPENVRLSSVTCTLPERMKPGEAIVAPSVAGGAVDLPADVTFVGQTYSHKDVAEFMSRLGLVPQLINIQLTSSMATEDTAGTQMVDFTVTASMRAYVTAPPVTKFEEQGGAQ